MPLTEEDQRQISEAVTKGIRDALTSHPCRIPITDQQAKEFSHAVGMIIDLGGGGEHGMSKGIEEMRKSLGWAAKMRKRSDKLGMVLMTVFLTAIGGGVVTALWAGLKALVSQGTPGAGGS